MPQVTVERIVGLDKKSSDTDLDLTFAQVLKNLSTTKKPGALSKDGAYADVSSSLVAALPAGYTLKNLYQLSLTEPENTDVYLAHAQVSGNDRLLMGRAFDNAFDDVEAVGAFAVEWRDMCERETGTTEATTNADQLTCTGLAHPSDNYYKFWYFRITLGSGKKIDAIATGSTAATGVITFFNDALTGVAASGEAFVCSRCPFLLDTGTEIPNVRDVLRYLKRDNSVIAMVGNNEPYPTAWNVWLGYIKRRFEETTGTSNQKTVEGFFSDMEQFPKPYLNDSPPSGWKDVLELAEEATLLGLTSGTWKIKIAYEYDGFQIGPLSPNSKSITVGSSKAIGVEIKIPFWGGYDTDNIRIWDTDDVPADYAQLMSFRITGIYIFALNPNDGDVDGNYKLVNTGAFVDIFGSIQNQGNPRKISEHIAKTPNSFPRNDFTIKDGGFLQLTAGGAGNTPNITEDPTGSTYDTIVRGTNLRPTYRFATQISSHVIAASVRTEEGERQDNDFIASNIDGAGVAEPNFFTADSVVNLGIYGSKEITGIHVLGDPGGDISPKSRCMILTDDDYYVLNIIGGTSFTFELDSIGQKEGLFAPDSLCYAEGHLFGVSRNGFRVFTPRGTQIIGEGLKTDFDALTDPSEAIGTYWRKERLVLFHFKTNSKTYAVDLLSQDMAMFEYELADTFLWFAALRNGNLLAIDASKIYQLGSGSTQDGTAITPAVKTKRMDARHFGGKLGDEIILTEGTVKYKSDTAITLNIYRNKSGTPITFNNLSLAAQSTEGEKRFLFPQGTRAKDIEAEVTLSVSQAASNTIFEFNNLSLHGYTKRRIS